MSTTESINHSGFTSARSGAVSPRLLFGRSEAMREVREKLERVAHTNVPVLIVGESGTGKEVVARYVHAQSPWRDGPFVSINCPAIPGSLLESELFGYEQGAFTGASTGKAGLVDSAAGGTLLFDGIGDLELSLQSKLLQLLQDGEFTRIGGQQSLRAEVRVLCAVSRPLEGDIEAGAFRGDLFYRINVVTVLLPPLRERSVDIPDMIQYFLATFSEEYGNVPRPISPPVLRLLAAYEWPGNIRQLQSLIRRYVILGAEDALLAEISGRPLAREIQPAAADQLFLKKITRRATIELERRVILDSLSANQWNRRRTAEVLHISYRALLSKMKQSGLPSKWPRDNRGAAGNEK